MIKVLCFLIAYFLCFRFLPFVFDMFRMREKAKRFPWREEDGTEEGKVETDG